MPVDQTHKDAWIRETMDGPPQLATSSGPHGRTESESKPQIGHGPGGRASRSNKLNLRAVSDVLESYNLDPIEELAKVLTKEEPHRARDGTVVRDEEGKPLMKPVVDIDTRVKLLTELAQYTRPKLKSVEVVQKSPELTDEQIDRRLQALLAKGKT